MINKKHKSTKIDEKILTFNKPVKKMISIFNILMGKKCIKKNNKKIINNNLFEG
tara:strand:- start:135 stop:296 length:162 start_codon:yes stop_codon:yes gene_type:complete